MDIYLLHSPILDTIDFYDMDKNTFLKIPSFMFHRRKSYRFGTTWGCINDYRKYQNLDYFSHMDYFYEPHNVLFGIRLKKTHHRAWKLHRQPIPVIVNFSFFFFLYTIFSRCSCGFCQEHMSVCSWPCHRHSCDGVHTERESCYHLNAHLSIQDFLICKLANVKSTICLPACFASPLGGTKQWAMSQLLLPETLSLRNHLQKSCSQLHFEYLQSEPMRYLSSK